MTRTFVHKTCELIVLSGLAIAMLKPTAATADEVVVSFTAIVWSVDDTICQCINTVDDGDTLLGFYVYDSELADTDPDTTTGNYRDESAPHGIFIYHDLHTFSSDPADPSVNVLVEGSGGLDRFTVKSYLNNLADPFRPHLDLKLISFWFFDPTGQATSSDSLLTTPPDTLIYTSRQLLISGGDHEWQIRAEIISVGSGLPVAIGNTPPNQLRVNSHPNPFNPSATITINLDVGAQVDLTIYDVRGRHIKTLARERLPAGPHVYEWDGKDATGAPAASGVYFATLKAGDRHATHKLVLLR